tara:strand:+ start:978 stop:1247 length:270 start_codon:yes stop_codon:yes gene_type:complete
MASVVILAAVGVPIFIIIIILAVLIYGSRGKISEIRKEVSKISEEVNNLKSNMKLEKEKILDLYEHVEIIGEWSMAAQEQINVPGFGGE